MTTYLLVDGNNLCHRNYHAYKYRTHKGKNTGILFGLLRDIHYLRQQFGEGSKFVFCFDATNPYVRQKDYPDYKKRPVNDPAMLHRDIVHADMRELRTLWLPMLGYNNIILPSKGYEADDVIASLVNSIQGEATRDEVLNIIMVSSDNDLHQLLVGLSGDHTFVGQYIPNSKQLFTKQHLLVKYGVIPAQWISVKALAGDLSDHIKGIPRVGLVTACKYIRGKLPDTSPAYKSIEKNKETWHNNKKIIRLPYPGTGDFDLVNDSLSDHKFEKVLAKAGIDESELLRGQG